MKEFTSYSKLVRRCLSTMVLMGTLALPGLVSAAGSLVITPSTSLSNGQTVSVSGAGFAASSTGSIVECNSDSSQPTVTVAGNSVPVSCTNPLSTLVTTDKSGTLAATSFTVHTGTVGPAASGTDSSGGNAATDAAKYPCPPTAAEIAAGDTCEITFGDAGGDDVSMNISFAGSSTSTTSSPSSSSSSSASTTSGSSASPSPSTSSTSSNSPLPNTGPGNTIGLAILAVSIGTLAHYAYGLRRAKASR